MVEEGNKATELLAYIGLGVAGAGFLFIFIPFICVISPILSQAAVILGLIAFVNTYRLDVKKARLWSILALVWGLTGLIIQTIAILLGVTASGIYG